MLWIESFLRQSQSTTTEPEPEKEQNNTYIAQTYWTPLGREKELDFHLSIQFLRFYSTFKQQDFCNFQKWNPRVSRLWSSFSFSDYRISRPEKDNKLPRISSASLELVVVPKTRSFRPLFGPNPNHSQSARNFWKNEGGSY